MLAPLAITGPGLEGASPPWLEEFEHTADAGFAVRAETLPELFTRAGWGLFSIITEPGAVQPNESAAIEAQAEDREALMVRWLSELNFRHVLSRRVFGYFEMRQFSEQRLAAVARGEAIDRERLPIYTEIKAITFHHLKIERDPSLWRAQIILDL